VIFTILNRVSSGQFQDTVQGVSEPRTSSSRPPGQAAGDYLPLLGLTQSIQFETILNLILAGPASTRQERARSSALHVLATAR
jgi:hypothetical protein